MTLGRSLKLISWPWLFDEQERGGRKKKRERERERERENPAIFCLLGRAGLIVPQLPALLQLENTNVRSWGPPVSDSDAQRCIWKRKQFPCLVWKLLFNLNYIAATEGPKCSLQKLISQQGALIRGLTCMFLSSVVGGTAWKICSELIASIICQIFFFLFIWLSPRCWHTALAAISRVHLSTLHIFTLDA